MSRMPMGICTILQRYGNYETAASPLRRSILMEGYLYSVRTAHTRDLLAVLEMPPTNSVGFGALKLTIKETFMFYRSTM